MCWGDTGLTTCSDMANIEVGWEVEGIISPQESVSAMLKVIESKGIQHSGTFWTWENKVGIAPCARTLADDVIDVPLVIFWPHDFQVALSSS